MAQKDYSKMQDFNWALERRVCRFGVRTRIFQTLAEVGDKVSKIADTVISQAYLRNTCVNSKTKVAYQVGNGIQCV